MKMIDVLIMMAEGNLKEGTILKFVDSCNEIVSYIFNWVSKKKNIYS